MEKLCINCNRYLDENMFSLCKGGKTSNVCSECEAKRKKEWYEKNKEKIKEQRKQKSEQQKEYMKNWHNQHKEDEKAYREEHKEKIAEYSKNYYEQNKDKQKEYYTKKNAEEETKLRKRNWYYNHIEEKKAQDKIYNQREREKVCAGCGKTFIATSNTKYCSDECYRKTFNSLREKTFLEKYGYIHPSKNPQIREKFRQTCIERYGVPTPFLTEECQIKNGQTISQVNLKFAEQLDALGIAYVLEYKLEEYSYDFYLPDYNLLVEINPTYTHTVMGNHWNNWEYKEKLEHYHLDKTNIAEQQNKHCIHIWQWDDWNKIINMLKPKEKLYARKLELKEINDKFLLNEFLSKNHIQGTCYGNLVSLGLYCGEELVQVMTFGKPRYNKNYQWELLRLCTNNSVIVIGGAERLFKYFIKQQKPESVISYCDVSKFNGDVYNRLGFKLFKQTPPTKVWSKYNEYITDNLLRQHGADRLIGTHDGKCTNNEEIMLREGWLPIYDCGQKVFVWYTDSVNNT